MSAPRLAKGQNQALARNTRRITVAIGWSNPQIDVDASALLLGSDRRVSEDADFVFYNQPASSGDAVRFLGITPTDDGGVQAQISIDLSSIPGTVDAIAIVGSLDSHRFADLGDLTLTFEDEDNHVLAEHINGDATTERRSSAAKSIGAETDGRSARSGRAGIPVSPALQGISV